MSWDEIDEHARNYLLSLLALGFDPEEGGTLPSVD